MVKMGRPPDSPAKKWMKSKGPKPPTLNGSSKKTATDRQKRPPKPPSNLGEHGRRMWRLLWRELTEMDILAASDMPALEMAAATYETWRMASESVQEHGVLIPDGRGALRKNPGLQVMRDADTAFNRWCRAFGLTPADAARLGLVDD